MLLLAWRQLAARPLRSVSLPQRLVTACSQSRRWATPGFMKCMHSFIQTLSCVAAAESRMYARAGGTRAVQVRTLLIECG